MRVAPNTDFIGNDRITLNDDNIATLFDEANFQADAVDNLQVLPIVAFGLATIPSPVGPFVNQTFTVTVPHNLGYTPIFVIYIYDKILDSYRLIPQLSQNGAGLLPIAPSGFRRYDYGYSDNKNLYINCRLMNNLAPNQSPQDILYTYYIFSNPALS